MGVTAFLLAAVPCAAAAASAAPATPVVLSPAARAALEKRAADVRLPAAGEAALSRVLVRSAPRRNARRVGAMNRLRFDYRPTVFFVIGREREGGLGDGGGPVWLRIRVPGRPNGQTGWVQASALRGLHYVGGRELVVDRSKREIRLLDRGGDQRAPGHRDGHRGRTRTVLRAPLAVGKPGAPTPLGSFYLTAAFRPNDSFLGPWAFETSAYAAISDWPQGGIVGLHGTSEPSSIGHEASHGCLRVYNSVILKLKRLVGPGTPLLIKR